MMKTLSLRLPDALDARLAKLAKKHGTTKSDLVRRALEEFVSNGSAVTSLSAHDLARDLCGSVKDAPPDLSTNPKYMEDFGK